METSDSNAFPEEAESMRMAEIVLQNGCIPSRRRDCLEQIGCLTFHK